ncbi:MULTISPECIES: hypothetical protein [Serratia]|uniref:hypothetical protein n=1 Tax=Serratia TaxID=613 RepID=UPI00313BF6D8
MCFFAASLLPLNAGLTVRLPKMGVAQVVNDNQHGYTPFSLNISCQNMQQEGIADRATSLFHVAVGGSLNSHFIIGMGAYYYPYQRDGVTQGEINTSATLNIIYP